MAKLVLLLLLTVTSQAAAQQATGRSRPASPTVASMRAHLFQNSRGELSEDILDPKYGGSWNSIAGPNAADSILVAVEVAGDPDAAYTGFFGPRTKYSVRLIAHEEGRRPRLLLDVTSAIPVLNERGRVWVPFLVKHGGCAPVRLTASIVGLGAGKALERTLRFACGE